MLPFWEHPLGPFILNKPTNLALVHTKREPADTSYLSVPVTETPRVSSP